MDITPANTVHLPGGRASTYIRCPRADRVKGFEHRTLPLLANGNEIHASTRENVVIPTTSVEVMGVCSNPSWLADLGKCSLKV